MSNDEYSSFEDLSGEPLEVQLVGNVTKCRSCTWFWRPPPYGPYPSYDFSEDYPEQLRHRTSRQYQNGDTIGVVDGLSRRQAIVNPQILHGCRKAPLMSIGINPNLTGFWPGVDGARWAYPLFSNFRRYAYYYRHRTVHQESLSLDFIRQHVREEGALKAKKAGRVKGLRRSMTDREMTVTLAYEDGEEESIDQSWDPENHFVLLYDRSFAADVQFQAGETIGGFIAVPEGAPVSVERNVVGYYQRVIPILEQVSAHLRSQGEVPNLEMAEDFCQLDMVACASPGWGGSYQIDKQEVVRKCVHANAWVIKQLIQSNPKVIIFSGRSAFQMFNGIFKPFITPALYDEMDVYGLMKYTARDPHYLSIRTTIDGLEYNLRARIIISPHFSYDDNFLPHARFSEEEWREFEAEFPDAYQALITEKDRVSDPNRDGYRGIRVDGLDDFRVEHEEPLIRLMRKLFNASTLIGQGIAQEILLGNVHFNRDDRHLVRAAGSCRFCVNNHWRFPDGCAYGKPDEAAHPERFLDKVIELVTTRLQDAAEPT